MLPAITRQDPRYDLFSQARNLRWPASKADAVGKIVFCETPADAAGALQQALDAGVRPTVRSGGHCYEDFVVNNPGGTILDLSLLKVTPLPADRDRMSICAGQQLGGIYLDLYKRYNKTIPGGSCVTVGAGGHLTGGGYGLLSRLQGLTVDWISAMDVLTVDRQGKVVTRRIDATHEPDLFRACRGGGGGNFGIVTNFLFDRLPDAPQEVVGGGMNFDWASMTKDRFVDILLTYGDYWHTRGRQPDTWGLYSGMGLSHSVNGGFGIGFQYCDTNGTCKDLGPLHDFLDRFKMCQPKPGAVQTHSEPAIPCSNEGTRQQSWIEATLSGGGGIGLRGERSKYKSAYMKRNFTSAEAKLVYDHLTQKLPESEVRGAVMAIGSYGGAVNKAAAGESTSSWQRNSIMKLQYQSYWKDPEHDTGCIRWLNDLYRDIYSTADVPARFAGTPYPGEHYEGCYINYPDADMLAHDFWPQLYYGEKGLYPFLQNVKRTYDPNNVFHHAMSVRA